MSDHLPLYLIMIFSIFLIAVLIGWPYCHIKLVFPLYSGVLPKKPYKRTLARYKDEWGKWERCFLLPLLDKRSHKIYRVWFVLYIAHIVNLLVFMSFEIYEIYCQYFNSVSFLEGYTREIEIILAALLCVLICILEGIALEIPHHDSKSSPRISVRDIFALVFLVFVILGFFIVFYKTFGFP